ncbi:hypothetical protein F9L16_08565 [Agarivorans sp. B2Z047]|uniref:hypothetical protein n=1 Tax=Agarivorans sp. B2Z047 TaxID=2652721 RepID=UPI00128D7F37|nr:hypothetical protein [Agarivorans sp. B2Z047]MPW29046.1 hypothetical protein [Agarivorans sp. B2Z047]UQN41599.1 hypothetical protein LQZ07_17770 [Agarivorans sp. B2Z047]
MKTIFAFIALLTISFSSSAAYTANVTSTVQWVKIYNNQTIYFKLNDHPNTPCDQDYFILDSLMDDAMTERFFTMLLSAKTTNAPVLVGYGTAPEDCRSGRSLAYALTHY